MQKHARNTDPESSHIAARANELIRPSQKKTVYEALRGYANITSAELAHAENLDRAMVARRFSDLETIGKAERVGSRICHINNTPAVAWCAV